MTQLVFNNRPSARSFNNLMDDFFSNLPSFSSENRLAVNKQWVPVNIRETEQAYLLDFMAPGFDKEDFKIDLDQNLLTISAEKKLTEEQKNEKFKVREFNYSSFKRSFTIDEKIDAANIVAKYLNGVLTLNLPKKAEVKEEIKKISVQ
jgi:HSP20 family protein